MLYNLPISCRRSLDLRIFSIIGKQRKKSITSTDEFLAAGREDLADKEKAQIAVMDEYAGQVEMVSEAEMKEMVEKVLETIDNLSMSQIIKATIEQNQGKPIQKGDLVKVVKHMLKHVRGEVEMQKDKVQKAQATE